MLFFNLVIDRKKEYVLNKRGPIGKTRVQTCSKSREKETITRNAHEQTSCHYWRRVWRT